jgi:monoamine oxidase
MKSVVVVGAGISGLAAAYRLTEGGVAVAVLESAQRVAKCQIEQHQTDHLPLDGTFCISSCSTTRRIAEHFRARSELGVSRHRCEIVT